MDLLQVAGITKIGKDGPVVNDVHFTQQKFENIGIAGETGSGKTTLLKIIAGLLQTDSGDIIFNGNFVKGPLDQLIPGHPQIAYLSQYFELRNNYWVYELLEMANKLPEEKAQLIYSVCQVEHLLKRKTDQLSGGEKQRIALARLLTASPVLLLLDEPFSNADLLHKRTMKKVVHDIGLQLGISCILVSHDANDLLSWAQTIFIMKSGSLIQKGKPQELYSKPLNTYCAGLLGEYNLLKGTSQLVTSVVQQKFGEEQLMLRPEHIRISRIPDSPVEGTVTASFFCGNYQVIDVELNDGVVKVQTTDHNYTTGNKVYLSFSEKNAWVFP